jgi:hypothetical protein
MHPVKQEPEDSNDSFIMEYSNLPLPSPIFGHSLATPIEVPLRASRASKEMRQMMGAFRLNPFVHNAGGRVTAMPQNSEDAGPLKEKPQLYEFQLAVGEVELNSDDELRSFSPDIEDIDVDGGSDCASLSLRQPFMLDNLSAQMYSSPTGMSAAVGIAAGWGTSDGTLFA